MWRGHTSVAAGVERELSSIGPEGSSRLPNVTGTRALVTAGRPGLHEINRCSRGFAVGSNEPLLSRGWEPSIIFMNASL